VTPVLSNRLHTSFTDHSVEHSDRVAILAQDLAAPLAKARKLKSKEAFVLYAACYLHDVGMQNGKAGLSGRLAKALKARGQDWSKLRNEERLRLIRENHHEISADMVIQSLDLPSDSSPIGVSLSDADEPQFIASLCEAHCIDTNSEKYCQLTRFAELPTMRLRLLSSLLRLADILDEYRERAPVSQRQTLDLDLEARVHWIRNDYVHEVVIEKDVNRVTIYFRFPAGCEEEYSRILPPLLRDCFKTM